MTVVEQEDTVVILNEDRHMLEVCLRLVSIISKLLTISKIEDNARLQCFYHVF